MNLLLTFAAVLSSVEAVRLGAHDNRDVAADSLRTRSVALSDRAYLDEESLHKSDWGFIRAVVGVAKNTAGFAIDGLKEGASVSVGTVSKFNALGQGCLTNPASCADAVTDAFIGCLADLHPDNVATTLKDMATCVKVPDIDFPIKIPRLDKCAKWVVDTATSCNLPNKCPIDLYYGRDCLEQYGKIEQSGKVQHSGSYGNMNLSASVNYQMPLLIHVDPGLGRQEIAFELYENRALEISGKANIHFGKGMHTGISAGTGESGQQIVVFRKLIMAGYVPFFVELIATVFMGAELGVVIEDSDFYVSLEFTGSLKFGTPKIEWSPGDTPTLYPLPQFNFDTKGLEINVMGNGAIGLWGSIFAGVQLDVKVNKVQAFRIGPMKLSAQIPFGYNGLRVRSTNTFGFTALYAHLGRPGRNYGADWGIEGRGCISALDPKRPLSIMGIKLNLPAIGFQIGGGNLFEAMQLRSMIDASKCKDNPATESINGLPHECFGNSISSTKCVVSNTVKQVALDLYEDGKVALESMCKSLASLVPKITIPELDVPSVVVSVYDGDTFEFSGINLGSEKCKNY